MKLVQDRRLLAAGDSFNRVVVWNLLTSAVDRLLQVDSYGRLGEAGIDHVCQLFFHVLESLNGSHHTRDQE